MVENHWARRRSSPGTGDDKDPREPGGKLCESKDWLRGDGGRVTITGGSYIHTCPWDRNQ